MAKFVGLDVSLDETSVCVVDGDGRVIWRGKVASEPKAIARMLTKHAADAGRIGLESGSLSTWLWHELRRLGLPIVCLDARQVKAALMLQLNKTDANDAFGLAQIVRTGWFREVQVKSMDAYALGAQVRIRARLVCLQQDLANQMRGILKTFGVRVSPARGQRFDRRLLAALDGHDQLLALVRPLLETWTTARQQMVEIERRLRAHARNDAVCRRLMTVPSVGVITALCYMTVIDEQARFAKSRSVGAYLGLTPRRYESGETSYSGRISKCGDPLLRSYLYEAAVVLLTRITRWSPLKSWAVRLAERVGFKKAAVATARKLAVVLHAVWQKQSDFQWSTKSAAA